MKSKIDLKDYFCSVPFNSLEIHNNVCFVCCPSWLPNKVELSNIPLKDIYNSEPVVDIRNSILDGSFKYCNKELCPYLSKLLNHGITSGPVTLKEAASHTTPIVANNTPDNIVEQRDLYDRRPSVLKSWSEGSVTMLGDAVHPMMPNLGQGGCQAIEDAYVLTKLLCDVTDKSQIPEALQEYYRQRIVRSAIVQGMSRLSSDIIISSFSTPFNLKEFLEEGVGYKYLNFRSILTWNLQFFLPFIFYAQFGYLYSFAPSSFTKETITKIVSDSIIRNKKEALKVYESLVQGCVTYFSAKSMSFIRYDKKTGDVKTIADASEMRKAAAMGNSINK